MKSPRPFAALAALVLVVAVAAVRAASPVLPNVTYQPAVTVNLWPGDAPGETGNIGPERVLPNRPRPFDQIENVSVPTLAVFHPPAAKRTGTGVLIIPGGGLQRLAIETEGYEVAEWLNQHGITAFLLKYRVPARAGGPGWRVGVQDAQRAMGLIRSRAAEWQVDPAAIGTVGFSSGAEINVRMSLLHAEPRQYPRVDAADDLSSRPDFNFVVYGAGFANQNNNAMNADLAPLINATTPPMFITHAFDDQALSSVILLGALKRANIPSELHIFAAGGHGFGVRDSGLTIGQWPDLALRWLGQLGFLDAPAVRAYAKSYVTARDGGAATLPRFSVAAGTTDHAAAFAAQQRVTAATIGGGGGAIAGYKGIYTSAAAQATNNVSRPFHGVLFRAGRLAATPAPTIATDAKRPIYVETEIGYVIATDIGTKLRVPRQALTTVQALVPVIEIPVNVAPLMGGTVVASDIVAVNGGSNQFIVGAQVAPSAVPDLDALTVSLKRDGQLVHEAKGNEAQGGQAAMLMNLINQIVEQGHVLRAGDIIISGALGGPKPGDKGTYTADYGPLGKIEFKVE
jgi:2-keto-4-pentenoate hydratase/acetyl esterase/lipase